MRPIKFRAWDEQRKIMVAPEKVSEFSLDYLNTSWFKLMQFTGLLDKNGKEIYEGDIIKDGDVHIAIKWSSKHGNRIIGYWAGFNSLANLEECVVLDNIYENPELIKN